MKTIRNSNPFISHIYTANEVARQIMEPKDICPHCGEDKKIFTGNPECNHVKYPEFCEVCRKREQYNVPKSEDLVQDNVPKDTEIEEQKWSDKCYKCMKTGLTNDPSKMCDTCQAIYEPSDEEVELVEQEIWTFKPLHIKSVKLGTYVIIDKSGKIIKEVRVE